jgi:coat protein Gp5
MANQFLTTDLITNEILAAFVTNHPFIMTGNRRFQGMFTNNTYKLGDTINVRKRNRFLSSQGNVLAIQPIEEQSEPLVVNKLYSVGLEYDTVDLTLRMDDFSQRYIEPAVQKIIRDSEIDIATQAITQLNYFTGTPGVPITTFLSVDSVRGMMELLNMPWDDPYLVISVFDAVKLRAAHQNDFNKTLNTEISLRAALGHFGTFDIFSSQSVQRHTAGNFANTGSVQVSAVVSSGTSIPLMGFVPNTANVLVAGDLITLGGVQMLDPFAEPLQEIIDAQFVVQANVNSDGAGNAVVQVSPFIITDPTNPRQNILLPIPVGTVVSLQASYKCNVGYTTNALDIVFPPLDQLRVPYSKTVTDKEVNVSLRVSEGGDIINNRNILRIDVLAGYQWHYEYAVKLLS